MQPLPFASPHNPPEAAAQDFVGHGVRDLNIGANWAVPQTPQTPRTLSLISLDGSTNQMVPAMRVVPNNSTPFVTFPSGHVGIGNVGSPPSNLLTVQRNSSTDPIADSWRVYSSRRWQTAAAPIEDALDKIQQLRGVTFQSAGGRDGRDVGFIAEEVGEVLPQAVEYEDGGQGHARSLEYGRIVALLLEGLKAQQTQIRELQSALARMEAA